MAQIPAVLTGDLVGSTAAGPEVLQASMAIVQTVAAEIGAWPGQKDTRFTRSRGDGWQMVLHDPADILRAILLLQARLRASAGLQTRISIGIGPVDSLGTRDLSDASGPAFTASGHGLDQMPRLSRLAIGPQAPLLQAILTLAEDLARRWSREQAEALALALPPQQPTLEAMAAQLAISAQAVNYRLVGAGLRALRLVQRNWEDAFDIGGMDR